ncbi:uncharacterized protein EHS24_009702 [Apiotrichum porosum]|uniref:CRAL-TRIO domain-containing protein n=1 Tax=Apiotrichum porosum TaxID=105984 RepID=A0A427XMD9_9TREE|nr:uncharacterized protein EHS24_009702 [Apiotrichum porosum]RSH80030.1 hypothetical protein EHS24_009702 [Apiotrichum porosum]
MSSFFKRASSSSASLPKEVAPPTKELKTICPTTLKPKPKAEMTEEQLQLIEELKEYTATLLLPESDPYHVWEKRFLNDVGTHARFMRAAKWKLEDGKKRIKATMEWRREFQPEIIEPGDIAIEAEKGKLVLTGFDQDARPVIYMRPRRENTEPSPRQIRHLIYHLERAIDMMPEGQEQVAIVVDYKQATSNGTPSVSTGLKVLHILQNHYVERLGRGIVMNMPWWINAFFSAITPFMDPITRDKIHFNPKLTTLINPDQLDVEYGGDYNYEFDRETYWKTLVEFSAISEDGTRVDKDGKSWIPKSGNGIVWAREQYAKEQAAGLAPVETAVANGSGAATPVSPSDTVGSSTDEFTTPDTVADKLADTGLDEKVPTTDAVEADKPVAVTA